MSQFINPSVWWVFPIMGLSAPIVYTLSMMAALYWVIRWKWRIALPVILLVALGANKVSLIVKNPFKRDYGTENYSGTIKIMSYNLHYLRDLNYNSSKGEIIEFINEHRPDILCMQEYGDRYIFDSINVKGRYNNKYIVGTDGIYSRYPIINRGEVFSQTASDSGRSIFVDVVVKSDTVRVYNQHLHSTAIKKEDDKFLTSSQLVRDTLRSERIWNILMRLNSNSVERAKQADIVASHIQSSPYPVIVCGDFNETPISYTYNRISKGLVDSFQVCGNNYSYTYLGFFNMLRIDYILLSPNIMPVSYDVDREIKASDHLPVVVRAKIKR